MGGTTWCKFFWSDWMSDPGVRASSYAARGLWMDMLCIASEHQGYVAIAGKKMDAELIAKTTGGTAAEVKLLLDELQGNGVFSRDRNGFIYCRRMIKAEKNRKNGKLGGNPNFKKNKENPKPVEADSKPHNTNNHKPEAKEEKTNKKETAPNGAETPKKRGGKKPVAKTDGWPVDYDEQFWKAYPPGRKGERKAVFAKLAKIRASGEVPWIKLWAGLTAFIETKPDQKYTPAPLVWLNKGRWDVEFVKPQNDPPPSRPERISFFDLASGEVDLTGERRNDH